MTKITHGITDDEGGKYSGVLPVIVDGAVATDEKSKNDKEYSQVVLDVSIDNGNEKTTKKKMFFRLPWDNWTKAGEPLSLFKQFRAATDMSAEDCGNTLKYKSQGFYAVIGPEKKYDSEEFKTYEDKEGKTRLSYGILSILTVDEANDEALVLAYEKNVAKLIADGRAQLDGNPVAEDKSAAAAGFGKDPMDF